MYRIAIDAMLVIILILGVSPAHAADADNAIVSAVRENNVAFVSSLLDKGDSPDSTDKWGRTLLVIAVQNDEDDLAMLLIRKEADLNLANNNGINPLIAAAQRENAKMVLTLITAGAHVNQCDKMGWTALMWAAYKQNSEIVKLLLAHGADPKIRNHGGQTALYLASHVAKNTDIARTIEAKLAGGIADTPADIPDHMRKPATVQADVRFNPAFFPGRLLFGSRDAPVTIVEYTDFECTYCKEMYIIVNHLLEQYPGKLQLVVKHYPANYHHLGQQAAICFEILELDNPVKAWQFYNAIFRNQNRLKNGELTLLQILNALSVDWQGKSRVAYNTAKANMDADAAEADSFGFEGAPILLINSVPVYGVSEEADIKRIIDAKLKGAKA